MMRFTQTIIIDFMTAKQSTKLAIKHLIDSEMKLRGTGLSGHIPVTPKTRMADNIRDIRRKLQELVKIN